MQASKGCSCGDVRVLLPWLGAVGVLLLCPPACLPAPCSMRYVALNTLAKVVSVDNQVGGALFILISTFVSLSLSLAGVEPACSQL